jgi:predicted permease
MLQDVKYALRILRRSPGFALAAILTFALGIGANTAIFSIVDAAILRPLPYDEPERLVTFTLHNPTTGRKTTGAMPRDFLDWRARQTVFDQVALTAGGLYRLLGAGEPEELRVARVSAGYFEMLRTTPALGRSFAEADEYAESPRVIIISHDFWKTRFASAPDAVGKTLRLDDQRFEIVGVLPERFQYPAGATRQTGIFLPYTFTAEDRQHGVVQSMGYNPTGRLRTGVSIAEAEAAMGQLQSSLDVNHAGFNKGYTRVELKPLLEDYIGDARKWMLMLLGAVGFVLLIACANVANLVLAHGTTRVRELTVRAAVGATRWRIARQLLAESLLISLMGAAAGLIVAWWGLGLLRAAMPTSIPRAASVALDGRVLAFTTAIALITGLVCGLLPAFRSSRVDFASGLKDGAPGATIGKAGRRIRNTLAWAEVALAVVLLVGAGLFIRSFSRLVRVNQGFDSAGVVSMAVSPPRTATDAARNRAYMLQTLAAIRGLTGVEAALTDSSGPYAGGYSSFPLRVAGRAPAPVDAAGRTDESQMIRFRKVSAGFLELLRVPLLRGRSLSSEDTAQSPPVALINEAAARRFWGDEDPLGQRIEIQKTTFEIVGVVGDMRYGGPAAPPAPEAFLSFEQSASRGGTFLVRASADTIPAIKAAIWNIDPAQPITDLRTAEEQFGRATAARRFNMLLMTIFAALALAIAATGIYSVIAFIVSQRTREIGVRVALGAQRSQVLALFLRYGAAVVFAGISGGLIGAWWLAKTVQSFLFEVDPRDPVVFALVATVLGVVGLAACWIPARRAARIDPLVALRTE